MPSFVSSLAWCICGMLMPLAGWAQGEANQWYFGANAAVSFNSGNPVGMGGGALVTLEGSASIADSLGNLLFYTDGITIWNANHVPMVNGTGLTGHSSSTQSALIVRQPGSAEQYYVFTTDFGLGNNGLRYSIVDMSLQGGLGAVTSVKNDSLYGLAAEKITAVFHANRKDLWVIAHDKLTNEFLAYLMTSSGLNTQPVVSATGMALNNFYAGYMKASPDGFRIAQNAMGLGKTEVYDFDNATGVVSNPVTLNAANSTPYGLEFSPNSKVLYTSHLTSLGVYQYDLTAGNAAAIQNSASILAPFANISDIYYGLQLGPDRKIYIAKNQHVGNNHLAAITNPDVLGAGSGYLETAVLLPSGGAVFGLPNFNQSYFHAYAIEADFWCTGDSTAFGLNNTSALAAVSWNFGDPLSGAADSAAGFEAKHYFSDTGSYVVQAIIQFAFNAFPDTLTDTITIHPLPHISFAANSTTLCQGDSVGVAINSPLPASYTWSDSSASPFLHPQLTGDYWVTATNGCGSASDSLHVVVEQPLAINLGTDTFLCPGATLLLDPHSAGAQHLWHNGSTDSTLEVAQADTVWLAATNACGLFADTLQVTARTVPEVNLGPDTVLCAGSSVSFNVAFPWASYAWNDGTAAAEHTIGSTGNWSVTVTASCGMAADTVHIRMDEPLTYSLGPDREACNGDTILVAPALPYGTTFRWNTGSTASELAITTSGRYWLQAGNACGTYPDTLRATLFGKPQLALGNDTVICAGAALTLRTDRHAQAYAWNTGHAGPTLQVTAGGTYRVTATNTCGQVVDSVAVGIRPNPVINLGRDTSWCGETPLVLTLPDDPEWTYAWDNGQQSHAQTVYEPGVYAVTVTDAWSCQAHDAVTITECPVAVFIPNAFSPNHEPPNDVFLPKGHGIATFDMEIFNRWGKLLFHSRDVYEGWDGTHQGIAVPIGNYVCRVRYTDATGREFQRIETIALVR